MMEIEQRMLKGFVTAASLGSENRSVSNTWFSDSARKKKRPYMSL